MKCQAQHLVEEGSTQQTEAVMGNEREEGEGKEEKSRKKKDFRISGVQAPGNSQALVLATRSQKRWPAEHPLTLAYAWMEISISPDCFSFAKSVLATIIKS